MLACSTLDESPVAGVLLFAADASTGFSDCHTHKFALLLIPDITRERGNVRGMNCNITEKMNKNTLTFDLEDDVRREACLRCPTMARPSSDLSDRHSAVYDDSNFVNLSCLPECTVQHQHLQSHHLVTDTDADRMMGEVVTRARASGDVCVNALAIDQRLADKSILNHPPESSQR